MSKEFEPRRIVCNQKAYDFMKNLAFVLSEATSKDFECYDFCYDLINKGLVFIELLRSDNVVIKDNL